MCAKVDELCCYPDWNPFWLFPRLVLYIKYFLPFRVCYENHHIIHCSFSCASKYLLCVCEYCYLTILYQIQRQFSMKLHLGVWLQDIYDAYRIVSLLYVWLDTEEKGLIIPLLAWKFLLCISMIFFYCYCWTLSLWLLDSAMPLFFDTSAKSFQAKGLRAKNTEDCWRYCMFLKYFTFSTLKKVKELKDWIYKAAENQCGIAFF